MKRAALIFSFLLTGCVTTPSDPLIEPSSSITGSLSQHDGCYWLTTPDGSEREVVAADLLPGNHAIGKLARQMETSDAARPFYRGSDHWRVA